MKKFYGILLALVGIGAVLIPIFIMSEGMAQNITMVLGIIVTMIGLNMAELGRADSGL